MTASDLLVLVYGITVVALPVAALTAIAITLWLKKNDLIVVAAGLLTATLILAALPMPQQPVIAQVVLGVLSIAISVLGGGPAATYVLRLATRGSVQQGRHGGILIAIDEPADAATGIQPISRQREVLRGGTTIGALERLAVTAALIAGFPEAIAVIVAIKGVGRFTELAAAEARERFIIGTLTSIIWACASAAIVLLSSL